MSDATPPDPPLPPPPPAGGQPAWGTGPGQAPVPPPPGGPPPAWGQQPGWGQAGGYAPTAGSATAALVCSILAWVVCPIVLAIVALVLASRAGDEIRGSGGRVGGDGMVTAARIIAWANIVLVGVVGLLAIVAVTVLGTRAETKLDQVDTEFQGEACYEDGYPVPC